MSYYCKRCGNMPGSPIIVPNGIVPSEERCYQCNLPILEYKALKLEENYKQLGFKEVV